MGGGDLNSKKSWHPNTMKNQERVWKAEQAAAEEKKRIMELQHERAAERDRAELNDLAKRSAGAGNNDDRLHWMYDKPDKKGQAEDYLLGKTIEKNYDQPEKSDDVIPAVARRVAGSSMLTSTEDSQVDLARKMREDPLLLVKERERAARAALLNNPLHRKRIADLLRKEQELQKGSKHKKGKKKEKDLDSMLAAKLNALGGEKGVDVAALLASDDSSSDSESSVTTEKKKKKKSDKSKKSKKSKKKRKDSKTEPSDDDKIQQKLKNKDKKEDEKKNKIDYQRNRNKRSESQESNKDLKERRKQQSFEQRRHQDHTESRYQRKRSVSEESDSKIYKKRRKEDLVEKRQNSSHGRRQRSESSESDNERCVKNVSKHINYYNEFVLNSDESIKKKRSRRDGSAHRNYKNDKRKQRSVSEDSNKKIKNKSRRDSSDDRNYKKDKRNMRSLSQDSAKMTKSKRFRRESCEDRNYNKDKKKKRSVSRDSSREAKDKRNRRDNDSNQKYEQSSKKYEYSRSPERSKGRNEGKQGRSKKAGLSAEEVASRIAEMAAAGAEREQQRGRRVAAQRAADGAADCAPPLPRLAGLAAHQLPASLEARIHSNRHYIQRNQSHMNENFARR